MRTLHTPRSVAATSNRSNGESRIVNAMLAPLPRAPYDPGVMPRRAFDCSYRRLLEP